MLTLQITAFVGPIVATFFVWWLGAFSGKKTNINSIFIPIIAGMEFIDFSFIPPDVAAPLVSGFAVAALISNSALSERVAP